MTAARTTIGNSTFDVDEVLAGRRYASVEEDDDGTQLGVGRVLSGPIVFGGPVDVGTKDETCCVSCQNCEGVSVDGVWAGEIEVTGRDDPKVEGFVREHRCPDDWDAR